MNKNTPHLTQKEQWEKEHADPFVLPAMDSTKASSGVLLFWEWLREKNATTKMRGIEMGCGKGRNSIYLATQGATMVGFDFSEVAIQEAKKRAALAGGENSAHFFVQDATTEWPYENNSFDFAIDCFASTDIDSISGRIFARDEFSRILKPGGYLFVYTLSVDDEFHKEMVEKSPGKEKNSFFHPTTGKFEKIFDYNELLDFYTGWKIIKEERITKNTEFFGKEYTCHHFWTIFQKVI